MFFSTKRVLKFAWSDLSKNWGSNIVAIFIMVLVISLISALFMFQGLAQNVVKQVGGSIDVSVYFKSIVIEEEVFEIKEELLGFSEIKEIQYISKEKALERFIERYKDDPVLMEALDEVGGNPFLNSLNIRTESPDQYENILLFLERNEYNELIEEVDYLQKKPIIERLSIISTYIRRIGIVAVSFFALISILVIFNAIKLTIYDTREEISTMKLVGASNWFIRGPFILQGAFYGLIASIISLLIFTSLSYFLSPKVYELMAGLDIFQYFLNSIWQLIAIQLFLGVGLGIISSLIVIRKHLKV